MADSVSDDTESQQSCELNDQKRGGWVTFPFMIATLLGFSITSFGWSMNLIVFLIEEFNIKSISAAQISNIVNGCLSMLPVVAAILADSFVGNIPVIVASAFISLLGVVSLTLISSFDYLRPEPCETGSILCISPSKLQFGVLYAALSLVTIGAAGMRVTLASGANQYENPKDQASFFNWYFLAVNAGAITSATAIVYTQDNISWKLGFGLCAAINLIIFVVFISGIRFYKHDKPMGSPFTSIFRIIVASTRNQKALVSSKEEDYHQEAKTSATLIPSKSFKFLNRAALKTKDDSSNWKLCTVKEVEDLKTVLRVLPIWLSIIVAGTTVGMQGSLVVLQALVTDRKLGSHFKVPAGSLQLIGLICTSVFLVLNNWIIFPFYKKLTHKNLTTLQQVGIGQVVTILAMAISAIVEAKRLNSLDDEHLMSVLWLFPPLLIIGVGGAFEIFATTTFFYGEFPESLKNTATAVTSVAVGVSFYLTTGLVGLIQKTTKWLPDDINHGRVDNVYWLLVVGGILNLAYFLCCSCFYTYGNLQDNDGNTLVKDVTK